MESQSTLVLESPGDSFVLKVPEMSQETDLILLNPGKDENTKANILLTNLFNFSCPLHSNELIGHFFFLICGASLVAQMVMEYCPINVVSCKYNSHVQTLAVSDLKIKSHSCNMKKPSAQGLLWWSSA